MVARKNREPLAAFMVKRCLNLEKWRALSLLQEKYPNELDIEQKYDNWRKTYLKGDGI